MMLGAHALRSKQKESERKDRDRRDRAKELQKAAKFGHGFSDCSEHLQILDALAKPPSPCLRKDALPVPTVVPSAVEPIPSTISVP